MIEAILCFVLLVSSSTTVFLEKHSAFAAKEVKIDIVVGGAGETSGSYLPNQIVINTGDTLTWTNKDEQPHTVTSGKSPNDQMRGGEFDSGLDRLLFKNDSFSHKFDKIGEFPYFCQLHPNMIGIVLVASLNQGAADNGVDPNYISQSSSLTIGTEGNDASRNVESASPIGNHEYIFGCTLYVPFYHCDPIRNKFENYAVNARFSKVLSVTREPSYINTDTGTGLQINSHALESVKIDGVNEYNVDKFSIFVSLKTDDLDPEFGNSYSNIVTYRNGIYRNDPHTSGWELSFYPSDDTSRKKLRFSVFNSEGTPNTSSEVSLPINEFTNILASFDGGSLKVFVDGELKSEAPFIGTYNPDPGEGNSLKIAGDALCSCYLTSAVIDEVRFYNRSLDAQEAKTLNLVDDNVDLGLIGQWQFDDTLDDSSALGNDAFYHTMIGSMAFTPDGRLFYTEKNSGKIRIITEDNVLVEKPFAVIPDVYVDWEQGLLGLTIDTDFNHHPYVYAFYNYEDESTNQIFARVVRFTAVENTGVLMKVLLDRIPASRGFHTGGALAFNSFDDKLYITVGDAIDRFRAENLTSLNGKVLRINRDGSIPNDNPFPDSPIYSYGHRNMYGIAFTPAGNGLISEPGATIYDEINYVRKGGNFGWPTLQPPDTLPERETNDTSIKPLRSYFQSANPTQIAYYDKNKFQELKDMFLVGTFRGNIHGFQLDSAGQKLVEEAKIKTAKYPSLEVVGIAVSPSGDVYFGAYDIYKLESIDQSSKVQIMYPVELNSSNIQVRSMSYDANLRKLTVDLDDETGKGSLSMKIENSMLGSIDFELSRESKTSLGNDGKTTIELPHKISVENRLNYSLVTLELAQDYPSEDNLQFILSDETLIVTKIIPEFPFPMITLTLIILMVVVIGILKTKNNMTQRDHY